jgi:hypothetical protein
MCTSRKMWGCHGRQRSRTQATTENSFRLIQSTGKINHLSTRYSSTNHPTPRQLIRATSFNCTPRVRITINIQEGWRNTDSITLQARGILKDLSARQKRSQFSLACLLCVQDSSFRVLMLSPSLSLPMLYMYKYGAMLSLGLKLVSSTA